MFKVVWKSFKYNRKNFLSFFMSEILSVAVIFMLIYIQEALSQVPGIKTEALQFAYQSELRKQLRIIIPCIILIMILVTGYSVKAYINTRMQIPLHRITDSASNGSVFPVVTEHFSASSDHAFL